MPRITMTRVGIHISIGSKYRKNAQWKSAKRQRHMENLEYRASLHREKQVIGDPLRRDVIQQRIDEISKRGK